MRAIEVENEELKDILPKTYNHLDNSTLVELLKTFNSVPMDIEGDARGSEQDIRKQLIKAGAVDVMVAVGSNFFYTVTLPCTLWFLDRGKAKTPRKEKVLFLDARHIYHQVDRAHRAAIKNISSTSCFITAALSASWRLNSRSGSSCLSTWAKCSFI